METPIDNGLNACKTLRDNPSCLTGLLLPATLLLERGDLELKMEDVKDVSSPGPNVTGPFRDLSIGKPTEPS